MRFAGLDSRWMRCAPAVALLLLAGCAARQHTGVRDCTPISELGPQDTLVLGGRSFQVAVLKSSSQRTEGLLNACPLSGTEGALFVMPSSQDWAFHTQGMTQPIEIAFFDEDLRLLAWRDAPPGLLNIRGGKPARYVLEVAPGTMAGRVPVGAPQAQAFVLDMAPRKACELVRSPAWQCPLKPGDASLQVTADVSGFSGWRGEKTECALKLSLCVMASADFARALGERTFKDLTPDTTVPKSVWARSSQTTQRPWSGKDVYAVLLQESQGAASHFTVKPVGFWWEVAERLPFTGYHARTALHSDPVKLFGRWIERASVPALSTTLLHEWMHVAYFMDPVAVGDLDSVVYGSEPFVEALARRALEESVKAVTARPPDVASGLPVTAKE